MKNSGSLTRILTAGRIALAFALVAGFTVTAAAQEKGATKLLQNKSAKAASATATMACSQCKDTVVTITERPTKTGAKPDTITSVRHECPGCKTTLATTGHGKAMSTTTKHTCEFASGARSACCAKN